VSLDPLKEVVRRSYLVYETGDLAVLDEILDSSYVDHNPVPGQDPGSAGSSVKCRIRGPSCRTSGSFSMTSWPRAAGWPRASRSMPSTTADEISHLP
jgi:hypothetical protein